MRRPLKVLIVDDEPPARKKIKRFLTGEDRFHIVGEAGDGEEALAAFDELRPDLLFLDIQMPGLNGFEVIEALDAETMPQIIFSTAYDQYALRAFEVNALDYLLKPFDEDRFREALDKAWRDRRGGGGAESRIAALLESLPQTETWLERFLVKHKGKLHMIRVGEIEHISSEEKYVRVHLAGAGYLYRRTMNAMVRRLDPNRFVRIHRTEIVNLDAIKTLETWTHGDYLVVLHGGAKLHLSRTYRDEFFQKLNR